MKEQKSPGHPIDILLKQTMKDDIPPDVEKQMNIHLHRFRQRMGQEKQPRPGIYGFLKTFFNVRFPGLKLGQQLANSAALVFAAVVFIILLAAAVFIPVTASQNDLAESFSTLTTSIYVSREISRSDAMECAVQAVTQKGRQLNYSIRWTPPDRTRVDIITQDKTIIKTLWIKDRRVAIADAVNNTVRHLEGIEHIDDPEFQPVKDFISPAALMARLEGKWSPRAYKQLKECDRGTYAVLDPGQNTAVEITVDMCTFLPIEMKKYHPATSQMAEAETGASIRFTWKTPSSSRLIDLKSRGVG